ncbi:MAG TPA: response regulator transcription factor [Chitinophagaceae bacterium]|nr:response regulator transcription factor [Chitinophagaceae bacterium]
MQAGILLFEDNTVLRESINSLIDFSKDFVLLGSFANAIQVEEQAKALKPELILMDIDMPGLTGIEAVKKIRKFDEEVHIIMLTVFEECETVLNAIFAGASGYLLKKHLTDRLLPSMNEVLSGGAPMSPSIARLVISNMHTSNTIKNKYDLTTREKEILTALSDGSSYKIIGEKLFISIDTVRSHLKNIYKKLHVHSQTEAVAKALNERIL